MDKSIITSAKGRGLLEQIGKLKFAQWVLNTGQRGANGLGACSEGSSSSSRSLKFGFKQPEFI
jgi:hypothetical protein